MIKYLSYFFAVTILISSCSSDLSISPSENDEGVGSVPVEDHSGAGSVSDNDSTASNTGDSNSDSDAGSAIGTNPSTAQNVCQLLDGDVSNIEKLLITFSRVDVLFRADDSNNFTLLTISNDTHTYDLLTLRKGILRDIGLDTLDSGTINEIRLILTDSAVVANGVSYPLAVPGGYESGLKLRGPLYVETNQDPIILIDFDPLTAVTYDDQYGCTLTTGLTAYSLNQLIDGTTSNGNGKISIQNISIDQPTFSPGELDGRLDIQNISFENLINITDGLLDAGTGNKSFAIDWTANYSGIDTGQLARTIEGSINVPNGQSSVYIANYSFNGLADDDTVLNDGEYVLIINSIYKRTFGTQIHVIDSDKKARTILIDNTPPTLSIDPADDFVTNDPSLTVDIAYSDTLTGIDLSSLTIALNGTDITSSFVVSENDAAAILSLEEGNNAITASIRDAVGNEASQSVNVFLDTVPPNVSITAPTNGQIISSTPLPSVVVTYNDPVPSSGLTLESLLIKLNGEEIIPDARSATQASFQLPDTSEDGVYTLEASISDAAGNAASANPISFTISVVSPLPPSIVSNSTITPLPAFVSDKIPTVPVMMATTSQDNVVALEFTFTVKDSDGNVRAVHTTGSRTLLDDFTLDLPPRKARLYSSASGPAILLPGAEAPPDYTFEGYIFYSKAENIDLLEPGDALEVSLVAIDGEGDRSFIPSSVQTLQVLSSASVGVNEPLEIIESFQVEVPDAEIVLEPLPLLVGPDRFNIFDEYQYIPFTDDDFSYSISDDGGTFTGEGFRGHPGSVFRTNVNILQRNTPSIIIRRDIIRVENEPGNNIDYRILEIPFGMTGVTAIEPITHDTNLDDDLEYQAFSREIRPGNELTEEQLMELADGFGLDPVVLANLHAAFVVAQVHRGTVGSYAEFRITQILWPETLNVQFEFLLVAQLGTGVVTLDADDQVRKPLGSSEPTLILLNHWGYIPTKSTDKERSAVEILSVCGAIIADMFINEEDFVRVDVKGCDIIDQIKKLFVDDNDDDFSAIMNWFESPLDPDVLDVEMIIRDGNQFSTQTGALIVLQFPIKVP